MAKPIKWLYLTRNNINVFSEEFLNKLGSDGWELISVNKIERKDHLSYHYIFKREILIDEEIPDWIKQHEESLSK
jgi:hypothetical protein